MRRTTRSRTTILLAALGALASLIALVPTAKATAAAGAVEIDATIGWAGQVLPGRNAPVTVRVKSDHLVRGTLVVRNGQEVGFGSLLSVRQPIEIPAGTDKTVTVVVPVPIIGNDSVAIDVSVDVKGVTVASRTATGQLRADVELVGLVGSTASDKSLPETTTLAVAAGTAQFVAVSDASLDQPGAIDPIDQIAITASDLAAMPAPRRGVLLQWIAEGGRLLVRNADGPTIDGVPAAWQPPQPLAPSSARPIAAGSGEIMHAGADWWRTLEPTPTRSMAENTTVQMRGFGGGVPVTARVAREAGLRAARLAWLGGFLVAYVLLAGVVAPIVVRRIGRPGLIWTAVPALALVFTAGAWIAGRSLRSGASTGHVTIVDESPAGAMVTTWVGAVSKGGGSFDVTLPPGWSASTSSPFFGNNGELGSPRLNLTPTGQHLGLDLAAGEFGLVQARGPDTKIVEPFAITATSERDGVVRGTVRNTSPYRLVQVAVFSDESGALVGELAAGAEKSFEISGTDSGQGDPRRGLGMPIEAVVWPNAAGFNGIPDPDDPSVPGALSDLATKLGSAGRGAGRVEAVGWTSDAPAALTGANGRSSRGQTGFRASVAIAPAARLTDASIRRAVVRAPGLNGGDPNASIVYAFTLPPDRPGDALSVRVPAGLGNVELWDGSAWVAIDVASGRAAPDRPEVPQPAIPPGGVFPRVGGTFAVPATTIAVGGGGAGGEGVAGDRFVALPAATIHNGRVYIRTTVGQGPFGALGVYVTEPA